MQDSQGSGGEAPGPSLQSRRDQAHQVLCQQGEVLRSFTQGGYVQVQHAQPVEQIIAELCSLNEAEQVLVCGGNDPHIDWDHPHAAHAHSLPFLQHAEESRL